MNHSKKNTKCIEILSEIAKTLKNGLNELDTLNARIAKREEEYRERQAKHNQDIRESKIAHIAEFPNSALAQQWKMELGI